MLASEAHEGRTMVKIRAFLAYLAHAGTVFKCTKLMREQIVTDKDSWDNKLKEHQANALTTCGYIGYKLQMH